MANRKVQRATISDVARMAGVSIATVSRVLNATAPVATETVERVRDAIQQLNFTPHAAARTLAVRKSDAIGLLLPEIGRSFFTPTLRGIEAGVREAGFDLLVFAGSPSAPRRPDWRPPLGDHNTDGLLVFSGQLTNAELGAFYEQGFPVVLLHRTAPAGTAIPSVRMDNRAGMHMLLEHLVTVHGCRRIVFLRGEAENEDGADREAAFRDFLAAHAIPFAPELVERGEFSEQGGEAAIERLMAAGLVFDAVFAGDDEAAAGALLALRRAGLRVPQDVKVVGFDDVPMARHLNPALTTVCVPIEGAGYLAAQKLVRLIRNVDPDADMALPAVLPVELVVRESCGCH